MRNVSYPCQARNANGQPCGNPASTGQAFCNRHSSLAFAYGRTSRNLPAPAQQLSFDFGDQEPEVTDTRGDDGLPVGMPRYALFRNRKVRILYYEGDNKFRVLQSDDSQRSLHRADMKFISDRPAIRNSKLPGFANSDTLEGERR